MHPASEWRVHPASHLWGCIRTIKLNTDNVHKYVDSTVWPAPYGNLAAPYQNRLIFGIHMHSGDGGGILLLDCTLDIVNRNSCYVYKSSTATRFTWDPCKIVHSVQYDAICTINGPTRNIVKCRDVYNVQFFSKNAWRNLCKLSILSTAQSCIVSGPTGNGHPMHRSFMSLFSLDPPIWDPLRNSDDDKSLLSIICHAQKEEGGERWSGFMRDSHWEKHASVPSSFLSNGSHLRERRTFGEYEFRFGFMHQRVEMVRPRHVFCICWTVNMNSD